MTVTFRGKNIIGTCRDYSDAFRMQVQKYPSDLRLKENMKSTFPALSQPTGTFHVLYLDCKFFLSLTRNVKR